MFSTWYVNLLTNWKWYWLVLAFYLIYNSSCTVQLTVRMKLNLLWRLVLCNCNICRMQWTYDVPVFFIMFLVEKKGSCKDCLPCSKEKRKKNYRNVIQKQIDYIAVIFITLKSYFGKEGIGEREREKLRILHLLVHPTSGCSGRDGQDSANRSWEPEAPLRSPMLVQEPAHPDHLLQPF